MTMAETQNSSEYTVTLDADAPELGESDRKDLDETRRLLYMALLCNRTKKYNLAGTIVNAMRHHQKHEADVSELMDKVVELVNGEFGDTAWAREQIEAITTKLDS